MDEDSTQHDSLLPAASVCPACGVSLGELRVRTCPRCGAPLGAEVWEVYQPPRGPVFRTIAVLIIALVVIGSIAMLGLTLSSQCSALPTTRPAGAQVIMELPAA